jgi:hypothetical protein
MVNIFEFFLVLLKNLLVILNITLNYMKFLNKFILISELFIFYSYLEIKSIYEFLLIVFLEHSLYLN